MNSNIEIKLAQIEQEYPEYEEVAPEITFQFRFVSLNFI